MAAFSSGSNESQNEPSILQWRYYHRTENNFITKNFQHCKSIKQIYLKFIRDGNEFSINTLYILTIPQTSLKTTFHIPFTTTNGKDTLVNCIDKQITTTIDFESIDSKILALHSIPHFVVQQMEKKLYDINNIANINRQYIFTEDNNPNDHSHNKNKMDVFNFVNIKKGLFNFSILNGITKIEKISIDNCMETYDTETRFTV